MYSVNIENGYIHSAVFGVDPKNSNVSKEEYQKIKSLLESAPAAPAGYYYRLRESLSWELCPLFESDTTSNEEGGGNG